MAEGLRMSAIEATTAGVKDMADNTLRITLEFEPRHAKAAFELFGARGTPVAIAALQCAPFPVIEQPKGGERAKWCGMRCQEPEFQRWIQERYLKEWEAAPGATPATWAASVIRAVCSVESRAELDNDSAAAERFDRLIRRPYLEQAK